MSSTCSNQTSLLQLNSSSSPTACTNTHSRPHRLLQQHAASASAASSSDYQASAAGAADLVFNKFIHIDSPRSHSASLFKRPGSPAAGATALINSKPTSSKWKAVLAHLTPPRLQLQRPVLRPATRRSSKSRLSPKPTAQPAPAPSSAASALVINGTTPTPDIRHAYSGAVDSAASITSDVQLHIDAVDCDPPFVDGYIADSNIPQLTTNDPDACIVDVHQLLQTLIVSPDSINTQIEITGARSRALTELSCLCVASPSTADRCVAADAVGIILNMLNSSSDLPSTTTTDSDVARAAAVEESEKALLLLQQLLTFSAVDGCAAATPHSSLLISTLGKKLLRVSEACTASAIAVLTVLCRHQEAAAPFCKAVSETAIPSKLVVVLQVASKDSTKRRAGRLLRLLGEQQQQQQQIEGP